MGKIDWDVVTNYSDTVTTALKTVTFPKVQEQVYLRNQGNANFTYTIGSQSGTLTPGQSVTVNQDVSSFTLQAVSGTHTFELRAKEKGTEINEIDSVAGAVKKVNGTAPDSNGNVTLPIPQVDTTNLATKTDVQNISKGSPSGVYATLTALQTAFPTGNSNIYLVTADGKWYFWNGSAWTVGGVYQASGVADNSLQPGQFAMGLQSSFGFTYSTVTLTVQFGIRADVSSNQLLLTSSSFYNVGSIDVQAGEKYLISTGITNSGVYSVRFFDASNNQVSQLLNGNGTTQTTYTDYAITVPTNAVKMYINRQLGTSGDTTAPSAKKFGSVTLAPQSNLDTLTANVGNGTAINDGVLIPEKTSFLTSLGNCFSVKDSSMVDFLHYYYKNGTQTDITTTFWQQICTLKFPVRGGKTAIRNAAYNSGDSNISNSLLTVFLDKNGVTVSSANWDSGTATASDTVTGTIPVNAVTAYCVVRVKDISRFMFVYGNTIPSSYVGYGYNLAKSIILPTDSNDAPDYWKSYIDGKVSNIVNEQMKSGRDSVCFGFFTDYHEQYSVGGLGNILNYLDKKINMSVILNGGDFLDNDGYATKDLAIQDVQKCYADFSPILNKMLVVDGNHERFINYSTNLTFSETELFSLMQRGNTKNIKPSDLNSLNYYYDDDKFKTRYIGLTFSNKNNTNADSNGINQDSLNWLVSVLRDLDAKTDCANWVVVLMAHDGSSIADTMPNYDILYGILKAVKNKTAYTVSGGVTGLPVTISVNDSLNGSSVMFTNPIAIAGVFCGHAHKDWLGTTYNGVDTGINIHLSCADAMLNRTATLLTTSEHAFDVICIDKKNRYVKSFRFGGNQPADGYTWDGTTREWNY